MRDTCCLARRLPTRPNYYLTGWRKLNVRTAINSSSIAVVGMDHDTLLRHVVYFRPIGDIANAHRREGQEYPCLLRDHTGAESIP